MLNLLVNSVFISLGQSEIWQSQSLPLFISFLLASRTSPSLSLFLHHWSFFLCPFCFSVTCQAFSDLRTFSVSFPPNQIVFDPNIYMVLMPLTPWTFSPNLTSMKPKLTTLLKIAILCTPFWIHLPFLIFLFCSTYHQI